MSDQAKEAVRTKLAFNLQRFAEEPAGGDEGQETAQPIVIDGVEYTPEQLKELISKGQDYTKKTQELARQRKEFEAQRQTFEKLAPYAEFIERLENDPNLQQAVVTAVQSYQAGNAPTQAQINTIKNAAENATDDDVRAQLEDLRLAMEIDKLKSKYEDFDEDAVIEYALREEIPDLEKAYKLMNYEKHQELAAKKALESAKKGASVPKTQTGNTGAPPGSTPQTPKTWSEATKAMVERMRALRGE